MNTIRRIIPVFVATAYLTAAVEAFAPPPCKRPLRETDIIDLVAGKVDDTRIVEILRACGAQFSSSEQTAERLRAAGSSQAVIDEGIKNRKAESAEFVVRVPETLDLYINNQHYGRVSPGRVTSLELPQGIYHLRAVRPGMGTVWEQFVQLTTGSRQEVRVVPENSRISLPPQMRQQVPEGSRKVDGVVPTAPAEQARREDWATQMRALENQQSEQTYWSAVTRSRSALAYELYLRRYPQGRFHVQAQAALERIQQKRAEKVNKLGGRATWVPALGLFVDALEPAEVLELKHKLDPIYREFHGALRVVDLDRDSMPAGLTIGVGDYIVAFGTESIGNREAGYLTLTDDLTERAKQLGSPLGANSTYVYWNVLIPSRGYATYPLTRKGGSLYWNDSTAGLEQEAILQQPPLPRGLRGLRD